MAQSISEDNGLAAMPDDADLVYSVGISTGGAAEMRMARMSNRRHVIATTINPRGIVSAQDAIASNSLTDQIEVRLEDVSKPLPYPDEYFDYIYARLVLHYLTKEDLDRTLPELKRITKSGGTMFIVVRSDQCPDALRPSAVYDEQTGLTTGSFIDDRSGKQVHYARYFHNEESLSRHLHKAGFVIQRIQSYSEQLFADFQRTATASHVDHVVEALVST